MRCINCLLKTYSLSWEWCSLMNFYYNFQGWEFLNCKVLSLKILRLQLLQNILDYEKMNLIPQMMCQVNTSLLFSLPLWLPFRWIWFGVIKFILAMHANHIVAHIECFVIVQTSNDLSKWYFIKTRCHSFPFILNLDVQIS
jgi:hypothetical protein